MGELTRCYQRADRKKRIYQHKAGDISPALCCVWLFLGGSRFHGHLQPELSQSTQIHLGEAGGAVELATLQRREGIQRSAGIFISGGTDGKSDQSLIRVQTGVFAAQILSLQTLDRFQSFS